MKFLAPTQSFRRRLGALAFALSLVVTTVPALHADLKARGSDSTLHVLKALVAAYEANGGHHVTLEGGGSGAGAKALMAGEVSLAFLSRELSADEQAHGLAGHAYAKDGVAIIVHPGNPVANLTVAELKDIYTGKTVQWSEGRPLVAFNRNADSGTREVFKEHVLGAAAFGDRIAIKHDGMLLGTVSKIPSAIAYTSLGEADEHVVKVVPVNGIMPSAATLKDGTYPIARTPTLATKGEPTGEEKAFVDFVLSPAGQTVVTQAGLVALH